MIRRTVGKEVGKLLRWLNLFTKYMYKFSQFSAEFCLFVITGLIFVDVVGRWFGRSTMIADEMGGYLLVAVGFLGFAYTFGEGRHISIEILTGRLSPRRQEQFRVPIYAVSVLVLVWLTYVTWGPTAATLATGQRSIATLAAPLWIPYALVPLGSAMLAIGFFVEMLNKIVALRDPDYPGQDLEHEHDYSTDPGI
jgi:TRAP-type C4-dicarboxylate transport system permease small subunit